MEIETIKKEKQYSLYELLRLDAFPWVKSYNSYLKIALTERESLGLLVFGEGKGTNYRIKGENLINFLNANAKTYEERRLTTAGNSSGNKKSGEEKESKTIKEIARFDKARKIGAKKRPKADVGGGVKIARKIRKQGGTKTKKLNTGNV